MNRRTSLERHLENDPVLLFWVMDKNSCNYGGWFSASQTHTILDLIYICFPPKGRKWLLEATPRPAEGVIWSRLKRAQDTLSYQGWAQCSGYSRRRDRAVACTT